MTDPFESRPSFKDHQDPTLDWMQHEFCRFPESPEEAPPAGIEERIKNLVEYVCENNLLSDATAAEKELKGLVSTISRDISVGRLSSRDLFSTAKLVQRAITTVQEEQKARDSSASSETASSDSRATSPSLPRVQKALLLESSTSTPLPSAKMMVLDDEETNGRSLCRILPRIPGLKAIGTPTYVTTTSSFFEKVKEDPRSKPDILFLDRNLAPGDISSEEFLSQVREDPLLQDITVILATSDDISSVGSKMQEQLDGYVRKGGITAPNLQKHLFSLLKVLTEESADRSWLKNRPV